MKAINIKWDIDLDSDNQTNAQEINLPNEIEIPDCVVSDDRLDGEEPTDDDIEAISDYITDLTGFCHNGFDIEY